MGEVTTTLITGATGKLGRVFALGVSHAGHRVLITSRNKQTGEALVQECLEAGASQAQAFILDLAKENAGLRLAEMLAEENELPDNIVNNARSVESLKTQDSGLVEPANWHKEYHFSVVLPHELSLGIAASSGTKLKAIVNIASMYGVTAANPSLYNNPTTDSPIHYGVAKAAMIHMTKELAVRLSKQKIRVNCISYGGVQGRVNEEFLARYAQLCPAGNMLQEDEVLGPLLFLCDETLSSGITGHNLVCDGGWTIW